jgi:hypothetical protein
MVGVTPQIMRGGTAGDYRLVDRLSQQLCERMRTASRLHREDAAGTDFIATFDPVARLGEDQRADQSALLVEPAGRRSVHHAGVGRRHVRLRRDRRRLFQRKYGSLDATPLVLEIRGGRLVERALRRARPASRISGTTATPTTNSDRVGELAFGTNFGPAPMIGILLQDEKFPACTSRSAIPTAARRTRLEVAHARRRADPRLQCVD